MGISELNKKDFYKCRDLINDNGQIEVKAIIAGVNPGRIFVDNIDSPKTGLIWLGNNDGFLFIGDESNNEFNNEINQFIDTVIMTEAEKVGLDWFEGMGNHQKWNEILENVFGHRKLGKWNQKVYTIQRCNENNEPTIDKDYSIVNITKENYQNSSTMKNNSFIHSKILNCWYSFDQFFEKGKGYCIVHNEEIVSLCFSCFVVENFHCIDIETIVTHRGKKLGQKIAHYFVRDCLENNMIPYWDCMEKNKPSVAIAENLGFTSKFNYVGYEFPLNLNENNSNH